MPDSSVTVRKMLSRGRNIMQWCSDSEAGKEISWTRVKLHCVEWIPGLLDGVERDCRLALLQGELLSSEGEIAFSVLLKAQESPSPSLLENTYYYFYLAWGRDWGLDVSMFYGGQGQAEPSSEAQPIFGALCYPWRSVLGTGGSGMVSLPGCRAGCFQHRMHAVS